MTFEWPSPIRSSSISRRLAGQVLGEMALRAARGRSAAGARAARPPRALRRCRWCPLTRQAGVSISARCSTLARSSASGLGSAVEPGVEDLAHQRLGRRPQAEREHVRVVPGARATRRLGVAAQSRPDAAHLVGRDRGPRAGPAADDRLVGGALRHVAGRALGGPGPVVAFFRSQRAVLQSPRDRAGAGPRPAPGRSACPCRSRPRFARCRSILPRWPSVAAVRSGR